MNKLILGSVIHATDPCYSRDTWCAVWNIKVKPGEWNYKVQYSKDEWGGGEGVKSLSIFHDSVKPSHSGFKLVEAEEIGVDSGQAGFFCDSIYPKGKKTGDYRDKESFYGQCGEATLGKGYDYQNNLHSTRSNIKSEELLLKNVLKALEGKGGDSCTDYLQSNIKARKANLEKLEANPIPYLQYGLVAENRGIVSSSGYGDGSYSLYKKENVDGEIIALEIKYI